MCPIADDESDTVCRVCGIDDLFDYSGLGMHIKIHKLLPKEYFDKFYTGDDGDLCVICGKKTKFLNINIGYEVFCSKECKEKGRFTKYFDEIFSELDEEDEVTAEIKYGGEEAKQKWTEWQLKRDRDETKGVDLKKPGSNDWDTWKIPEKKTPPFLKCQICELEFNSPWKIGGHLRKVHGLKRTDFKEYYDKYLKKDKEGTCKQCGVETIFMTLGLGYRLFCSNKCSYAFYKGKSWVEVYPAELVERLMESNRKKFSRKPKVVFDDE